MNNIRTTKFNIAIIIIVTLIISSISSVYSANIDLNHRGNVIQELEKDPDAFVLSHKKSIATEDEFNYDRVNVVLKHKNSQINKAIRSSDFNSNLFSNIEDLSYVEGYSDRKESNKPKINEEEFHQILSFKLKQPSRENVLKAVEFLNSCDSVLSASPDYIYEFKEDSSPYELIPPNDTLYSQQWGLAKINIENTWEIVNTTNIVNVGIFEEGISTHEDIDSNRVVQGNLQYNSNLAHDHGTHVAGVLGATTGNAKGIAGVAQVNLICLDSSQFVNSLTYAANNDIFIINFSGHYIASGTNTPAPYNEYHAAAIQNYPGLIICSAGNDGVSIDVLS